MAFRVSSSIGFRIAKLIRRVVMFTGGGDSQGIKLWDIRNKQCVYELSTGNTEVSTLTWNSKCATLYASTGCPYVDRTGIWHGYRTVRHPALRNDRRSPEGRGPRYRGRGFDEDDDCKDRYWPKEARHDESSFGYIYDAGDHSLCTYTCSLTSNRALTLL